MDFGDSLIHQIFRQLSYRYLLTDSLTAINIKNFVSLQQQSHAWRYDWVRLKIGNRKKRQGETWEIPKETKETIRGTWENVWGNRGIM